MDIILVINSFLITLQHIITDAAEILEPIRDKIEHVEEGESIKFRCIGVGHPPPLVQWRKVNGSLSDRVSSTNMSMSTNEGNITRVTVDLMLSGVSREDTGDYECLARNLLKNVTRSISLIVQCMQFHIHTIVICIVTIVTGCSVNATVSVFSKNNYVIIMVMLNNRL